MADRIKGITIEIGGDTTGLNKALSGTNKEINNTQRQLKDVERLLRLDPKNTELLSQKQQLLAQSVEKTKEKLESLKSAEKQVQQQFKEGSISQQQYDNLQREIIETEQKLTHLEKEASNIGSVFNEQMKVAGKAISEFGDKTVSTGKKINSIGKKASIASAAIGGIGIAAVTTSANFESGMSKVEALSGATSEEMENLKTKAQEMGATTAFSAIEAADAMSFMALAGWDSKQMIAGISGIMDLAAASGEDLASTSDIVTDALTAFGLAAEDSAHFADVLATTSAKSNTDVAGLGEAFKQCSALAGAMGYTVEDVTLALGTMANAGIKGSMAGTALKNTIANLAKPTEKQASAMDTLKISLTDSAGSMKSLNVLIGDIRGAFNGLTEDQTAAYAATLFGKESMAGMLSIIGASTQDYNELAQAINNADGSSSKMADTMLNNLNGQLTLLKSSIESAGISIGNKLMPVISAIVDKVQQGVEWFNNLSDSQQNIIIIIGLLVAAIGPALLIIGTSIITIGMLITQVGNAATTISKFSHIIIPALGKAMAFLSTSIIPALGAAMSFLAANPIVLVIAALVALVAAVVTLWNKSEEFRLFFISLGENMIISIEPFVTGIVVFFSETIPNAMSFMAEKAKAPINALISLLNGAISGINILIGGLNSLSFELPDWLPGGLGGKKFGLNVPTIPHIPMLAKGGTVLKGSAIVGEAGPELLTVSPHGTTVTPLSGKSGIKSGVTVNMQATFYGYKQSDGIACVRDLNRQLGRLYR